MSAITLNFDIFGLVGEPTIFGNLRSGGWGAPRSHGGGPHLHCRRRETPAVFTAAATISGVERSRGHPLRGRNRPINGFPTGCKHSVDTTSPYSPNVPPLSMRRDARALDLSAEFCSDFWTLFARSDQVCVCYNRFGSRSASLQPRLLLTTAIYRLSALIVMTSLLIC